MVAPSCQAVGNYEAREVTELATGIVAAPDKKLGPNDTCWCGSGRKYKRCHRDSRDRVRPGVVSPSRTVPDGIMRA